MSALSRIVNAARTAVGRWRRDHVHAIVSDRERASAFGMIGGTTPRHHFARICFGEHNDALLQRGFHWGGWPRRASAMARQHGLVVISEVPIPTEFREHVLRVPTLVALRLDLHSTEKEFLSGLSSWALRDLRKVRNGGFTFEVSRDENWAETFHDRFHRPAMAGRHGDEGYVMPTHGVAQLIRDYAAEFVCVSHEGRRVGALLAQPEKDGYALRRIGWLDGDPAWPKTGVIGALYAHAFQHARTLGLQRVLLGGTPPYVEDGVFQFKMKWGAALDSPATVWGDHHLLIDPAHEQTRRVLGERSFICHGSAGKFFVLSARKPAEMRLSAMIARGLSHWFCLREAPVEFTTEENRELPLLLRPWFASEPLEPR